MGKTLITQSIRTGTSIIQYSNVYYKPAFVASISVVENDADPLHKLDIMLSVSMQAVGVVPTTHYTAPQGAIRAIFIEQGSTTQYDALSPSTDVYGYGNTQLSRTVKIKEIERTSEPQTLVGTLTRTSNISQISSTIQKSVDINITIPPFKQIITDENCRITYTSGGVEYDLLNWK